MCPVVMTIIADLDQTDPGQQSDQDLNCFCQKGALILGAYKVPLFSFLSPSISS